MFSTLTGGRGGIVILVMIWDKIVQFFNCSVKVFWPEMMIKSFIPANNVLPFCHQGFTGLNMFHR